MAYTEFYVGLTGAGNESDVNGGGPSLGANGAPIVTRTNCDAAAIAGSQYTIEDKDGGGWGAAQVDDWLCWDTAGTKNFCRIDTLSYGADSNVIEVYSLSPITTTGKTVNVGGAWATIAHAVGLVTTNHLNDAGDVPRINVQAGTYTIAAAITPGNSGTQLRPITIEGYTTAAGDATAPVVTIDAQGNVFHIIETAEDHWLWRNMTATNNTGGSYGIYCTGKHNIFWRCCAHAIGRGGITLGGEGCLALGCEVYDWGNNASNYGITLGANTCSAVGCYVHEGTGGGIITYYNYPGAIVNCLVYKPSGNGIATTPNIGTTNLSIINTTIYDAGDNGLVMDNASGANQPITLQNCLIVGCDAYGIASAAAKGQVTLCGVGFQGNASGEIDGNTTAIELVDRISLAADPLVAPASDDFRLKATVLGDAGERVLGGGWPDKFLKDGALTSWQGWPDFGAVPRPTGPRRT